MSTMISAIFYRLYFYFSDEDLGDVCEGHCEKDYVDCSVSCSDTNCFIECGRAFNACVLGINCTRPPPVRYYFILSRFINYDSRLSVQYELSKWLFRLS